MRMITKSFYVCQFSPFSVELFFLTYISYCYRVFWCCFVNSEEGMYRQHGYKKKMPDYIFNKVCLHLETVPIRANVLLLSFGLFGMICLGRRRSR